MTRTLGWDIGGAHLKAALAEGKEILRVWQLPCPLWRDTGLLEAGIDEILAALAGMPDVDRHAVTMTGELADIFPDRRTGVESIVRTVTSKFRGDVVLYAGPAGFVGPGEARSRAQEIASANWHASAALAAREVGDALFVDMGSTTTDLVPLAGNKPFARGLTDRDRLIEGELVYQGFTRTPLMAVTNHVPFRGRPVPVMNEFFATMADVQRIVGALDEEDDQHPAADNGEKSVEASRRRLARMVGADAADASDGAWEWLAHAFAEAQIRLLHDAALQVSSREDFGDDAPVVAAGAGRPVIRRLAARLDRGIVDFSDLFDCRAEMRSAVCRAAPAAALALLAAD